MSIEDLVADKFSGQSSVFMNLCSSTLHFCLLLFLRWAKDRLQACLEALPDNEVLWVCSNYLLSIGTGRMLFTSVVARNISKLAAITNLNRPNNTLNNKPQSSQLTTEWCCLIVFRQHFLERCGCACAMKTSLVLISILRFENLPRATAGKAGT